MRSLSTFWRIALVAIVLVAPLALAEESGALPVVDGVQVLASVNGEAVSAADLRFRIGAMHQGMGTAEGMLQKPDTSGLLERVINARLIVQEAYQIGLNEIPNVASTLDIGRKELIKRFLIDERVKNIHEGYPDVAAKLYRDAMLELKIRSALFQSREDATAFETAVRGGADFTEALAPFIASEKALLEEGPFLRVREMRPEIASILIELEPGSITDPLEVQGGFVLIKVLESRLPEDPVLRADAEETALAFRKQEALEQYSQELRERYVKVNEEVRDGLDFDAPEHDFEASRKDERVVAKVKGAAPVTVGELTLRVERQLYHGIDQAAERRRVNKKLAGVLDRIVLERAMELEAARLKIEKRADFQNALLEQEEGVLFSTFISRVVNPDIKISDEEVEAFYAEHTDEYMTSAMIRLQGLPFEDRDHAEAGLEKLRQGSDLNWMLTHANGLVKVADADEDEAERLLKFGGRVLAVAMLPKGVQQAVEGASAGDFRLYAQPGVAIYVLVVQETYPAQPLKLAEIRDQILQRLFVLKREQAMEQWTKQLRDASEIEVYATEEQIRAIVGLGTVGER